MFNKNPYIQDFTDRVILKSWTWERLTDNERHLALIILSQIKSNARTMRGASQAVRPVYAKLLNSLGYKPLGWRDDAIQTLTVKGVTK